MYAKRKLLCISLVMLLAGCGEGQVSCVPAEVSQANIIQSQQSLNARVSEAASANTPFTAKNPQAHVFLDVSFSLRGYLSGATCADCLSPPGKKAADGTFHDPLFSVLINSLTDLPLRATPGATVGFHLFAEKVVDVGQNVITDIARDAQPGRCYDQNVESNRKLIENREFRRFARACNFEVDGKPQNNPLSQVGSRNRSPFKPVLDRINTILTSGEPVDEALFVIASDLFFSNNQDVVGPNAAVVAPLAKLLEQNFVIRLYGFRAPFSGTVDDVPAQPYAVRGLAPFYYFVIGTPRSVERFAREMNDASKRILFQSGGDEGRRPLDQSNRYNEFSIGAQRIAASSSFATDVAFPDGVLPGLRAVESTEADFNAVIARSTLVQGQPVTVTWRRTSGASARPPVSAADYRATVLAWRWTGQAESGDRCPASWELIPQAFVNPTPLAADGNDALRLQLFTGGGSEIQAGVPYVVQVALQGRNMSGGWVEGWSSDTASVLDEHVAAQKPGAVIRTYNLYTLFRSLTSVVPQATVAVTPPLASRTISIRFD